MKRGFTLVEVLIVITIIGILGAIVMTSVNYARQRAYLSRAKSEFRSIANALELYYADNLDYPDDAARDTSPGIDEYLTSSGWPQGPWPGSVYDWDRWEDPDDPDAEILQISIRFCPVGGVIDDCQFPNESWASDFNINSAVYYCVQGNCRAHIDEDITYPGYCVNCNAQPDGTE